MVIFACLDEWDVRIWGSNDNHLPSGERKRKNGVIWQDGVRSLPAFLMPGNGCFFVEWGMARQKCTHFGRFGEKRPECRDNSLEYL